MGWGGGGCSRCRPIEPGGGGGKGAVTVADLTSGGGLVMGQYEGPQIAFGPDAKKLSTITKRGGTQPSNGEDRPIPLISPCQRA